MTYFSNSMDTVLSSKRPAEALRQDLVEAIKILKSSILLYDGGQKESFKIIAGQLRLLLCDTNRGVDSSLLRKVFPKATLHPLSLQMPDEKPDTRILFVMSGTLSSDSNHITDIFDVSSQPISLDDWLDQRVFDPTVTIRSLIRSVADKLGGAHVDGNLNETLQKTSSTYVNKEIIHSIFLVEVASYVVKRLDFELQNDTNRA